MLTMETKSQNPMANSNATKNPPDAGIKIENQLLSWGLLFFLNFRLGLIGCLKLVCIVAVAHGLPNIYLVSLISLVPSGNLLAALFG